MFGSFGAQELILIFVIALIIFGPRRLPDLGKSLGRSIAEFKRASNELRNTLEDEIRVDEQRQKPTQPAAAAPVPGTEPRGASDATAPTMAATAPAASPAPGDSSTQNG